MSQYIILTDKLHVVDNGPEFQKLYKFWCPGCDEAHVFTVRDDKKIRPGWEFNENIISPSFTPSLLYPSKPCRCHLFLTDGKIHYCSDCGHTLAGQVVDMVPIPE